MFKVLQFNHYSEKNFTQDEFETNEKYRKF